MCVGSAERRPSRVRRDAPGWAALVGNFIGGGLLIGLYYAYVNDDAEYLRTRPPSTGANSRDDR